MDIRSNRRDFLKRAATLAAFAGASPLMKVLPASAACSPLGGKHLVVIYADGGKDWLHWLQPTSATLQQIRPTLYHAENTLLPVGSTNWGLHPNLSFWKQMSDAGKMAFIPRAHYVNASGSHDESRDQYLRGNSSRNASGPMQTEGLYVRVARLNSFDSRRCVVSVSGTDRGTEPSSLAVNFDNINSFGFSTGEAALEGGARVQALLATQASGAPQNAMQDDIFRSWDAIRLDAQAFQGLQLPAYATAQNASGMLRDFGEVEALIRAFPQQATITFLRYGGHDTHGGQAGGVNNLTNNINNSMQTFWNSLGALQDSVVMMELSEFGRTNRENGNAGTDHAESTLITVMGNNVVGGVYGDIPSANDLTAGRNALTMVHNQAAVQREILQRHLGLGNMELVFPGLTAPNVGFMA